MLRLIKWSIKTVLLLTGLASLFRCGSGYKERNGKISFNGKEISDKTFVVLSDEFAKDSATAYYKDKAFAYADVATFEAVDEHYAKDKNKVYYCDEYREGQNYYLTKRQTIAEVNDAHPASFVSLDYGYGKDRDRAYFEGNAFSVKDVATLVSIDRHFSKDNVHAYLDLIPVAGSEGETFELIDRNFAQDAHHIYYYSYTGDEKYAIARLSCDKATFEILDYQYSRDKDHVFFLGSIMDGAKPAAFTVLTDGYSKDADGIYFESQKIDVADPATFEVFKENGDFGHDVSFARDKATVYMNDKAMKGAGVATFKVLGENYGSDKSRVFYQTHIVKNADPETFKVYPHDIGNADAEDAKNKFHEGIPVKDE